MVNYELVKITINVPNLTEVIINMVVYHHGVLESIVINQGLLFTSKFCFLLYYFLKIKKAIYSLLSPNGQLNREIK